MLAPSRDHEALKYLQSRYIDLLSTNFPDEPEVTLRPDETVTIRAIQMSDFPAHQHLGSVQAAAKEVVDSFDFVAFRKRYIDDKMAERQKLHKSNASVVDQIWTILTCKRNRRGTRQALLDVEAQYKEKILQAVQKQEPVQLVMPSFPVKCWNPLKVERREPDLGELYCLCRLYGICIEIEQVYSPGAVFNIVTDGLVYAPLFEEPITPALDYRLQVEKMINQLQISKWVKLFDMAWHILDHLEEFEGSLLKSLRSVQLFWKHNPTDPHRQEIIKSTRGNINLTMYSRALLRSIFFTESTDAEVETARKSIWERGEQCALKYTAFVKAINDMRLVARVYSSALRVTCHPKIGQLGLQLIGSASFNYPWNGVAVIGSKGKIYVRLEEEVRNDPACVAVHVGSDPYPFYYREVN